MFLYWKKRGAYELEALPPSLTQVGIERYSWSSSLDVIHDLCDDKPVQEEDWVVCQHPECPERRRASKLNVEGQGAVWDKAGLTPPVSLTKVRVDVIIFDKTGPDKTTRKVWVALAAGPSQPKQLEAQG
ncbi:pleckstrin homology domain-containing family G member 5 isoform X1 [Lates japonicus]|uniref:Pleckstrin homology domain-containing family G member 5 isoform X1 n=1 Tax=Lates japonicus TaxID=270547 RepID=A0AAD3R0I6_LATJO|nr:pleckstrin homology domain-containing family G member 5 isoform X1 [Lates japonicus]